MEHVEPCSDGHATGTITDQSGRIVSRPVREINTYTTEPPEPFLSPDETVDAFTAHGLVILTGIDAHTRQGAAIEVTVRDAKALGVYLTATYGAD